MIFVVADREHDRRRELTTILISAFPGSTVYQHTNLAHASGDVLRYRVDALFAADEQNGGAEQMEMLQKKRPELPVFLLSDMEKNGYRQLSHADVAQRLQSILLTDRTATSHLQT